MIPFLAAIGATLAVSAMVFLFVKCIDAASATVAERDAALKKVTELKQELADSSLTGTRLCNLHHAARKQVRELREQREATLRIKLGLSQRLANSEAENCRLTQESINLRARLDQIRDASLFRKEDRDRCGTELVNCNSLNRPEPKIIHCPPDMLATAKAVMHYGRGEMVDIAPGCEYRPGPARPVLPQWRTLPETLAALHSSAINFTIQRRRQPNGGYRIVCILEEGHPTEERCKAFTADDFGALYGEEVAEWFHARAIECFPESEYARGRRI